MKKVLAYSLLGTFLMTFTQCSKTSPDVVKEKYVHQYGVALAKNDWMARGSNGKIISTMKNGVVVKKNYSNGVLDGETTYSFPHSDIVAKTEEYHDGNLLKITVNYTTGSPKISREFSDENTLKVTSWYPTGTPKAVEVFEGGLLVSGQYFDSENNKDSQVVDNNGTRVVRNEYGEIDAEDVIEDGEMVAKKTFYPSGATEAITPYKGGIIEGQRKTFLPNGEPLTVEIWLEGQQQGITTVFKDGAKFAEVPYVNGIKHGVEKRLKHEDFVAEEITWEGGKRTGPTYYYIDGDKEVEWYYNGKKVSKSVYKGLSR